jgi:hypothetical protein
VLMPAPVKATMCLYSMIHRAIVSMCCSLVMVLTVKGLVVVAYLHLILASRAS